MQEKFDEEHVIEVLENSNEEQSHIANTIESLDTDDDVLIMDGAQENKDAKRRRCEDCDIPFITKKQLKVN